MFEDQEKFTMNEQKSRSLMKIVVSAVLAACLVFGTFVFENKVSAELTSGKEVPYISVEGRNEVEIQHENSNMWDRFAHKYILKVKDKIKTNDSTGPVIYYPDGALIRMAPDTEIIFNENGVEFLNGRIWVNTLYSSSDIELFLGNMVIDPINSIFEVKFAGGKVFMYVHKQNVRVSLYEKDELLNSLLVAEGNRIDIDLGHLSDKISQILYSKLIKEFRYGKLSEEILNSDNFYSENFSRDAIYSERLIADKIQYLRDKPLYNISTDSFGYKLGRIVNGLSSYLVFSDVKKSQRNLDFVMTHLYDLEHLFVYYLTQEALLRIDRFDVFLDSYNSVEFLKSILREFKMLSFATPLSDLYPLKEFMRKLYLNKALLIDSDMDDYFYVVRTYLNDASHIINEDRDMERNIVDDYALALKNGVSHYRTFLSSHLLIEENQIFDNLLLRSDALYKDKYFSYKSYLEEKWLEFVLDEDSKMEEQRMIVSKKIMFLKKARDYFLAEELSLDDTKSIVYRLFEEIENYRLNIPQVAVDDMIAQNLSDLGMFWDFLNSPEYSISLTHGTTRQERYKTFLGIKKGESGLQSLRKKILGNDAEVDEGNTYDVKKEIFNAFSALGATNITFGEINSFSQRFVDVYGILSGSDFSCNYDREGEFLADVMFDNKLLTSGIKLDKLRVLVDGYKKTGEVASDLKGDEVESLQVKIDTKDEKLAKLLLTEKLEEFEFDIDRDQVVIVDLDRALFRVNHEDYSFEIDSLNEKVGNVVIHFKEFDKELDENIELMDLKKRLFEEMPEKED